MAVCGVSNIPEDWILWSVGDIAGYLGCGRSTVYRYMADPEFPAKGRPGGGHPRWRAVSRQACRDGPVTCTSVPTKGG